MDSSPKERCGVRQLVNHAASVMDREAYAKLATEIAELLLGLQSGGKGLSDLAKEFQRVWTLVQSCQTACEEGTLRNKDLAEEVEAAKAEAAASKSQQQEFMLLRSDLESEVRKLTTELHAVETSHDTKQETGKAVQEEIKRMQAIVSAGPDWTAEQKAAKRELESELSQLNSHLKEKQNTQSVLQRDVSMLTDLIKAGTEATAALVREKEDVQTAATGVSRNTRSLESKKELVDRELKSLQQTLDSLRGAVADKEAALRAAEGDVAARERANKVIDTQIAQVAASGALIAKKTGELTEELDGQMVRSQSLLTELDAIEGRTRKYDAETATIRAETSRCGQLYELCLSKLGDAEQELAAVIAESADLEAQKQDVRAQTASVIAESKVLQVSVDDLNKERDVVIAGVRDGGIRGVKLETLLALQHSTQKTLEGEVASYRAQTRRMREELAGVMEAVAVVDGEADTTQARITNLAEQIKMQAIQVTLLQKTITMAEQKSAQQQDMYESIRKERTKYCKALTDIEAEIAEITANFKMSSFRIDQHKDGLTMKDNALVRVHVEHHQVQKEIDSLRSELSRTKRNLHAAEMIGQAQEGEIRKLLGVVTAADAEKDKQAKECTAVIAERDLLFAQYTGREAELSSLYEKLKVQASSLERGQHMYAQRRSVEEGVVANISRLRKELFECNCQIASVKDLKKHVIALTQELQEEQLKVVALEQEARRPLNVHRWRQLESSDPALFDLISRAQKVQKRLLQCTDDIAERDSLIKQKEALYLELKTILMRQPDAEATERLTACQVMLKQKQQQLAAMEAELASQKAAVGESKKEIEMLNGEVAALEAAFIRRATRK